MRGHQQGGRGKRSDQGGAGAEKGKGLGAGFSVNIAVRGSSIGENTYGGLGIFRLGTAIDLHDALRGGGPGDAAYPMSGRGCNSRIGL